MLGKTESVANARMELESLVFSVYLVNTGEALTSTQVTIPITKQLSQALHVSHLNCNPPKNCHGNSISSVHFKMRCSLLRQVKPFVLCMNVLCSDHLETLRCSPGFGFWKPWKG